MINALRKQKGIALITVLFMFAVVTVVLAGLVVLSQNNSHRASHYLASEQAYMLCLSGEEWARQLLHEDFTKHPDVDHMNENWAKEGLVMKRENGYLEIKIEDAQGRFNMNNLADVKYKVSFANMLDLSLGDTLQSMTLAEQMSDWLDADNITGIEELDYLSEEPPYRTPNMPIAEVTEIRWLKSIEAKHYQLMRQQVQNDWITLPKGGTTLNVNTLTPAVAAGLSGLSLEEGENMVAEIRAQKDGITQLGALPAGMASVDKALLGVKSSYFLVSVRAKYGDQYAYIRSLVFRDSTSNGKMVIISRDRSKRFIFPFSEDYNADDVSSDFEIDI